MVYHNVSQITPASYCYWRYHIGVVFFGGPDDREAVAIASRMVCHPKVHVNIIKFCTHDMMKNKRKMIEDSHDVEDALDRRVIYELQKENIDNNRLVVSEVTIGDIEQIIGALRSFGDKYDLMIVGRSRGPSSLMVGLALEEGIESPELGAIGDLLASFKYEHPSNIIVVQNYNSR
jgi:filamentous hemagglutinin family protein